MVESSTVIVVQSCPAVWYINGKSLKTYKAAIGEDVTLEADIISNTYPRSNWFLWYVDGQERRKNRPSVDVAYHTSLMKGLYTASMSLTTDTAEDFGEWMVQILASSSSSTSSKLDYSFTVEFEGPPVLCQTADRQTSTVPKTLTAGFRSPGELKLCIISKDEPSIELTKLSGADAQSDPKSTLMSQVVSRGEGDLEKDLVLNVASLNEADIGRWKVLLKSRYGSLALNIDIKPSGASVLCSPKDQTILVSAAVDESLTFSLCFLTTGGPYIQNIRRYSSTYKRFVTDSSKFRHPVVKQDSYGVRYNVTFITNFGRDITTDDFALWKFDVQAVDQGKYQTAEFMFHITPKGPPVLCNANARRDSSQAIRQLGADFGLPISSTLCILNQDESLRSDIKIERSPESLVVNTEHKVSFTAAIINKTSESGLEQDLMLDVANMSEADVGTWIVQLSNSHGYLTLEVDLQAKGPPILCPGERFNKSIAGGIDSSLRFDICVLSPDGKAPSIRKIGQLSERDQIYESRTSRFKTGAFKVNNYQLRYDLTLATEAVHESDFGLWRLEIYSNWQLFDAYFVLKPEGPPQCPTGVRLTDHGSHFISLAWNPGHDGGAEQKFIVYTRQANSSDQAWTRLLDDPVRENYFNVTELESDMSYEIRVVAVNKFSDTTGRETLCTKSLVLASTEAEEDPLGISNPAEAGGGQGGGGNLGLILGVFFLVLVVLVVVVAGFLVYRRRDVLFARLKKPKPRRRFTATAEDEDYGNASSIRALLHRSPQQQQCGDEQKETVIDNPLYATSADIPLNDGSTNADEGRYMNEDGLVYVTVDFNTLVPGDGKSKDSIKAESGSGTERKVSTNSTTQHDKDSTYGRGLAPPPAEVVEYCLLDYHKTGMYPAEVGEEEKAKEEEENIYNNDAPKRSAAAADDGGNKGDAKGTDDDGKDKRDDSGNDSSAKEASA